MASTEYRYVRSRSTAGIWRVSFMPDGSAVCPCPARVSECFHIRTARDMTEAESDAVWAAWHAGLFDAELDAPLVEPRLLRHFDSPPDD